MADKLTVEQRHRDAAAEYWRGSTAPQSFVDELRAGEYDEDGDSLPAAFARFEASLTPPVADTPTGDPNYRRRGSDATEALREKITSLIDEVVKTDTLSPWFGVRVESLGKFVFQNRKVILAALKGDTK